MPENKLPGLTAFKESELRAFYKEHFDHDAAPELTTKPQLIQAIKAEWAKKYPDADTSDDAGKTAVDVAAAVAFGAPGSADFDVDNAGDEDFAKHEKILRRRATVADLSGAPTATLEAIDVNAPTPPVATPPGVTKLDTRTGLEHTLAQATWDLLSKADLKHYTDVSSEKPATLQPAK